MSLNKCKRLIVGKCGKSRYFNTTFYTESILIYLPSYFTQPLQAGKKFLLLKLFPDFFPISSHCFAYQKLKKIEVIFFSVLYFLYISLTREMNFRVKCATPCTIHSACNLRFFLYRFLALAFKLVISSVKLNENKCKRKPWRKKSVFMNTFYTYRYPLPTLGICVFVVHRLFSPLPLASKL